jgi:hypothetical protein
MKPGNSSFLPDVKQLQTLHSTNSALFPTYIPAQRIKAGFPGLDLRLRTKAGMRVPVACCSLCGDTLVGKAGIMRGYSWLGRPESHNAPDY